MEYSTNQKLRKHYSSTSSQPQNKSTEHSSPTYGEPQMTQTEAVSTVGCSCSSPSFSLRLTKVVNILNGEDDDNVIDSNPPPIDSYQVKSEYIPILEKIQSRYGDIVEDCTILTIEVRSSVLEMICGIISELQEMDFYKISDGFLLRRIALVNEFKDMKVKIDWLHQILDEFLEARRLLERYFTLKELKNNKLKVIENAQRKIDECEEQKIEVAAKYRSLCDDQMVCKEALEKAMDESVRINETVKYALSKLKRFIKGSLVDDLI